MTEQRISYSRQQKALGELVELDVAVEEKKKELKKQKELDHFRERIKDIVTTKEDSQKEIDLWLGLYSPIKDKAKIFLTISLLMSVCFASAFIIKNSIIVLVLILLGFTCLILIIALLIIFSEIDDKEILQKMRYGKLKEKTLSTDYTLNSDVIDCPIEVKKDLLNRLDKGFVYLSVSFGNHHLYYYTEDGYMENCYSAFSKEYDYFKDQLTEYKVYKISDIIMDNARR